MYLFFILFSFKTYIESSWNLSRNIFKLNLMDFILWKFNFSTKVNNWMCIVENKDTFYFFCHNIKKRLFKNNNYVKLFKNYNFVKLCALLTNLSYLCSCTWRNSFPNCFVISGCATSTITSGSPRAHSFKSLKIRLSSIFS